MAILDTIKRGAATLLGSGYDYLTPGKGSSRLTDYGAGLGSNKKPTITSVPTYNPSTTKIDTSAYDKEIAASSARIKELQASLAAQPKLPFFDTSAAWAKAQKGAEKAWNPVYVDKLNQYLEKARLKRAQTQEQTTINKGNIATGLDQTLEDVLTGRSRTAEDAVTGTKDSLASEAFDQKTGGTAFDRARTALLGEVANAGLTTSGIGAQQESNAVKDRNITEGEQSRQYKGQRDAIETLKTRTFEDLDKTESRAKTTAEGQTKQQDVDLKNFIDNAGIEEKEFRTENELSRLGSVASEVGNQYQLGVADFIKRLIGSGTRAQDIALAQQVYG